MCMAVHTANKVKTNNDPSINTTGETWQETYTYDRMVARIQRSCCCLMAARESQKCSKTTNKRHNLQYKTKCKGGKRQEDCAQTMQLLLLEGSTRITEVLQNNQNRHNLQNKTKCKGDKRQEDCAHTMQSLLLDGSTRITEVPQNNQ